VPPAPLYTGKPTIEKLGVKPAMRVCVINAPTGSSDMLQPLPDGVGLTAKATKECDLFLAFVRSRRELNAQLATLTPLVTRQTVWIAWSKKAAKRTTDLNGNVVRETGLASGWVDFKICSIDDTWSGLAFKRRK
jgi:hypothetical protein